MIGYKTLLAALLTRDDVSPIVQVGRTLLHGGEGKLIGLFTLSPVMCYGSPESIA